ncbi:hypothetical protein ACE01N_09130 [Saccharicrinis sp. FJH2]|uniref:hypothetical protein n=1 Tax=Saccharicrinis sp. FJH65 TaxID=3344659 RepID=UPI0035F4DDF9
MKKILFAVIAVFSFAVLNAQTSKKETIAKLFTGVMVMSDANLDDQLPIQSVNELAAEKADKTAEVTKETLPDLLKEAAGYSAVFMTVGNHTIVKITDLKDCQASGAWGTCMPKGEGYVQKGELQPKEGYINFIIGVPDGQVRKIFMFK